MGDPVRFTFANRDDNLHQSWSLLTEKQRMQLDIARITPAFRWLRSPLFANIG